MLVLSRKPSERIFIGEDIVITVVRIGPNTVRLGIEAPKNIHVKRAELPDVPLPPCPQHDHPSVGNAAGASRSEAVGNHGVGVGAAVAEAAD